MKILTNTQMNTQVKTQNEKRHHVFSRMKQMKDTGWLYQTLLNSDIPKTINTNGIFLNISCLSDEHLEILYNALADMKCTPIKSTNIEYSKPELSIITNHPKKEKQYMPLKLNALQKKILDAL
jgi:hypothetical protein